MESHYREALVGIAYSDDDDETESPKLIAKRALESSPFEVFVKELQNAEALEALNRLWLTLEAYMVDAGDSDFCDDTDYRKIRAALEGVPDDLGARYHIEFDGFTGTVIGSYKRLDGEEGVVMQQDGCKVVHVYRRKWLTAAPKKGGE